MLTDPSGLEDGDAVPALTVVTVVRDDVTGIQRTVESLARQRSCAFTHVVIDGASQDGTVAYVRENPATPHLVVVSEPDDGIYDAMNKGLALAADGLVTFLNAGDYYVHDSVLSRAHERWTNEGWAWGFGRAVVVDAAGRTERRMTSAGYSFWAHALGRGTIVHQTVFFDVATLRAEGGFDTRYRLAADYRTLLALGRKKTPATWATGDVAFVTGGASDRSPGRALREMHRARCEVLSLGPAATALDAAWAGWLLVYVYGRRWGKVLLRRLGGGRLVTWWITKTT